MTVKDVNIDGTSLNIREFKLEMMVNNPSICMIAKRGSGKSVVCRSIIDHFRDIPGGVIIAPTDRMSCFYGKFFPDSYIHYNYSSNLIEKILARQSEIIDKAKEKAKQGKKVNFRTMLVMDDCLASKGTWVKDECILEMFFNGRHYKIMYILTMQFPLGISPELRGNFDYIFLLADDVISNQKRMHDHYAGMFPTFASFRQVFTLLTADYGCMVIVNRGSRPNFLDKIFWYKADDRSIKTVGSEQFKKYHQVNYNKDWRKKSKTFDMNKFVENKKSKLSVSKIETHSDDNYNAHHFH